MVVHQQDGYRIVHDLFPFPSFSGQTQGGYGFKVSDRIKLGVFGDGEVQEALAHHGAYVAAETLATEVVSGVVPDAQWLPSVQDVDLDGKTARIGVRRARKS